VAIAYRDVMVTLSVNTGVFVQRLPVDLGGSLGGGGKGVVVPRR